MSGDEAAEIAAARLVDAGWYLARYKDVAAAGVDAAEHFARHGWQEGRAPCGWLDPAWYLAQNPDVAETGIAPVLHYLRHGEAEGRRPSPHFDPGWYRAAYASAGCALGDFLARRASGEVAPSAVLWAAAYLPGAGEAADPYWRCVQAAEAAGQAPRPDIALVASSGLVDANYYLIRGGDVLEAGADPVEHFCTHGWQEHRRPNLYFDTDWYLDTNPEVRRLGLNPLVHYIARGERAGRRPVAYFDPAWYRATYAEALSRSGLTPLAHYLAQRRVQAFSPNALFDLDWYLARHGAEVGPNRDAFAHYLQKGTLADLQPSADFNAAAYRRDHFIRPAPGRRRILNPERDNPLAHYLRSTYA